MAIYIITFSFSILGFLYADIQYDKQKVSRAIVGSLLLGVMPLCLLAAFRSDNIGTDVLVYGKPTFIQACNSTSLLQFISNYDGEVLFGLIGFVSAKIFKSLHFFWFIIELLCVSPIYYIAIKNRNNHSIAVTMFVYMFVYYPMSFNVMRQSIAAGILMLAFFQYISNKKKYAIIWAVVSVLFHSSAILGILLYLVVLLIQKPTRRLYRWITLFLLLFVLMILFFSWESILNWAVNSAKIIPYKYAYYFDIFQSGSRGVSSSQQYYFQIGAYGVIEILFRYVMFIIPIFTYKIRRLYDDGCVKMLRYTSLASICIYTLCIVVFKTTYGYRLTMFLDFFNILYLSGMYYKNKSKKIIDAFNFLLIVLVVAYFICIYVILGAHQVVPYEFSV